MDGLGFTFRISVKGKLRWIQEADRNSEESQPAQTVVLGKAGEEIAT